MSNTRNKKRNRKKAVPLAPPPAMRSRKRARVVTTLFHKYTRHRELAIQQGDAERVRECDEKIAEMGGRQEYQRASQLSTAHHSTSKWVLGVLTQAGWIHGIPEGNNNKTTTKKHKIPHRKTRLLEVGAINTELLNAAKETVPAPDGRGAVSKYRLHVRAIDLHSSYQGIEEADFLTLPLCHEDLEQRYDVAVCSMVINCVPTPEQRGTMLTRLFHQLRPGGLCFLTLPKLCLKQSPYMTPERFCSLLSAGGVGFEVVNTKESPKVSFFILRRPLSAPTAESSLDPEWTTTRRINRGKKYRNNFAVVLNAGEVNGSNL